MNDAQATEATSETHIPQPEGPEATGSVHSEAPIVNTTEGKTHTAELPDPVHTPPDAWTCIPCGNLNSPSLNAENEIVPLEKCWNCGAERSEKLEEIGVTHKTVEALAGGLAEHAANAPAAESVERPAGDEGPKAEGRRQKLEQPELKFPEGRFDAERAFKAIADQNRIVCAARAEYEDLKGQASEAKKILDKSEETLSQLINREDTKKHGGDQQPYLREVDESGAASCPVSSAMGAPCPACASQRAKGGEADVNDPLHPAHPQHEAIAKSLLVKDAQDLATRLQGKHFYMEAAAIMLLPIDELQTLQRYSVQNGVVPPELLVSAHIAAAAGTDRQECKTCGLVLIDAKQIDLGASFYPEHAAVGLDCEGKLDEQPKAEARAPKSHAKKNKKRKAAPEQEAAAQVDEGKKRAKKEPAAKKAKKAAKK